VLLGPWVRPLTAVIEQDLHGDTALLTWNLWHVTESVLHAENPYRAGSVYYPIGGNLTTHTYTPGFLPIGLLVRSLQAGEPTWPLAAYRATTWVSFALALFAAFHALRALGAGTLAALAASVAWAFAAVFRSRPFETHLVSVAFLLPLLSLVLARFVMQPQRGRALALAATAAGCVYFSEYYTPFLWLGLWALVGFAACWGDTRATLQSLARTLGRGGVAAAAGLFLLTAAPFLINWSVSHVEPFREDQAYFESANLAGFVVPDPAATPLYSSGLVARLNDRVHRGVGGAALFLGLPVMAFGAVGAVRANPPLRRILLALSATFFVLSLGPELKVFRTNTRLVLPYRALMLVPPFDLARAPARLAALGLWPLVCLQAVGLSHVSAALSRRSRGAGAVLAFASLAWSVAEGRAGGPAPAPFQPPPELFRLPPGAVLNLPVSDRDSFAMFLQVFHGRPIATGHLSRRSLEQIRHVGRLDELLRGEDLHELAGELQRLGIGSAVLARGTPNDVVERLRHAPLQVVDLRDRD